MHKYCHLCGGELPEGGMSQFCPHCGSPQIVFQDYEQQAAVETGAVPPPRVRQVEWKTAIRCSVLVAGIAAGLGLVAARVQMVSPLSWLWTISGSIITLALYQERRPLAWMDAGVGARIGVVVGLALVAGFMVAMGVGGLVARYGLHSMAGNGYGDDGDGAWSTAGGTAAMVLAGDSSGNDAGRVWDDVGDFTGFVDHWRSGGWIYADAAQGFGVGAFHCECERGRRMFRSQEQA